MMLQNNDPDRYYRFSKYLKERFGGPVRKVSLDAGFTCPNRDGSISSDGCIFCDPESFSPFAGKRLTAKEQLDEGIRKGKKKGIRKFIAYFQAYTNTYAPVQKLKETYDTILDFPEIVMLAIGTRPDCIDADKLDLIAAYAREREVWIEYGLQSINDTALKKINRGHGSAAFLKAVAETRQYPELNICAHVILGLPGEGPAEEQRTARTIARLHLEGVKLHALHAVKGTRLARDLAAGSFVPLDQDEYTDRAVRFLEALWPDTVIGRLAADCPAEALAGPAWIGDKSGTLHKIEQRLKELDTRQGKAYTTKRNDPKSSE